MLHRETQPASLNEADLPDCYSDDESVIPHETMSDLYQLDILHTDRTQIRVRIAAINHSEQPIPLSPLFYLSALTDLFLISVTGSPYAPPLTSTVAFPGLTPDGQDHTQPLLAGILDAHPLTLRRLEDEPALLTVTEQSQQRSEHDCLVAELLLTSPEPGLFDHLVVGTALRIVHGEDDTPLCALLDAERSDVDRPVRDPRLNYRLQVAVNARDLAAVRAALDAGASPDAGTPHCVLIRASHIGSDATVELLLRAGAEPNMRETTGQSALYFATNYRHLAIARRLLEAGAAPDLANEEGLTPLHLAALTGQEALVSLLLAHNATLSSRDARGNTPLLSALRSRQEGTATLLMEAGADVHATNSGGFTALMLAIGSARLLTRLLDAGADPSIVNQYGETALALARRTSKKKAAIRILEQRGETA
ncbi:MAG: hypothetical protein ACI8S6_005096 [Myxococcota bacterium]|jgi:hypothetical protein